MAESWLRLSDESEAAYAAFLTYRDLGEDRNVLDAFRKSKGKPGVKQAGKTWNTWAHVYRWRARVRDYDNHCLAQKQAGADRVARSEGGEWERRRSQQVRDDYELAQQLLKQARLIARFPVSQQKTTKDGQTVIVEPVEPRHLKDAAAIARDAAAMAWEAIGRGLGTPEHDPARSELEGVLDTGYPEEESG